MKLKIFLPVFIIIALLASFPALASSASSESSYNLDVGWHWAGVLSIFIFILSYFAVLTEEFTHMRKSKPVMLGAGLIWIIIALAAPEFGASKDDVHAAISHGLNEYASLMLFLLVAMTYISALESRNVFAVIRIKLIKSGMSYKKTFLGNWALCIFLVTNSRQLDNSTGNGNCYYGCR